MLEAAGTLLAHPKGAVQLVKQHYKDAKEAAEGKAVSKARLLKMARDIPEVLKSLRPRGGGPAIARRIPGARIRMHDGKLYDFFTDGSLRHAFGRKVGKMARKALKRGRRLERYRTEHGVATA